MIILILIAFLHGIAELIPISSSMYISPILAKHFNNFENLNIFMHAGSATAVALFYRNKLAHISCKLCLNLFIALIPISITGLILKSSIKITVYNSFFQALIYIMPATILYLTSIYNRKDDVLSKKVSLIIGLSQVAGLIEGFSRLGSSLTGGNISGLNKKDNIDFAFILGVFIPFGAIILKMNQINLVNPELIIVYVTSFVSSTIFIKKVVFFLKNFSFLWVLLIKIVLLPMTTMIRV